MEERTERSSNFELLRIVAIFMIILHHMSLHTNWTPTMGDSLSVEYLWLRFILMGGKVGVNIFVLISGYFLSRKSMHSFKRIMKLWGTILFYSLFCYGLSIVLNITEFSLFDLVKNCMPVTTVRWWYASTYFILFLFYPFINKLVDTLEKKEYQRLLLIMLVIWSIIPTLTNYIFDVNDVLWFLFLYLFGAYIRKYGFCENVTNTALVLGMILSIMLSFGLATLFDYCGLSTKIFGVDNSNYFYEMNHTTTVLVSVMIFLVFRRINITNNSIINTIAKTTFGIYLLHDSQYIQLYLWNDVVRGMRFDQSLVIIPVCLLVGLIIFVIGLIIELVRQNTIEKAYEFLLNRLIGKK